MIWTRDTRRHTTFVWHWSKSRLAETDHVWKSTALEVDVSHPYLTQLYYIYCCFPCSSFFIVYGINNLYVRKELWLLLINIVTLLIMLMCECSFLLKNIITWLYKNKNDEIRYWRKQLSIIHGIVFHILFLKLGADVP